jgi:predicted transcriptional regulator of viral defense system
MSLAVGSDMPQQVKESTRPSAARTVREIQRVLGSVFSRRDVKREGLADRATLERLVRAGYVRAVRRGVYEIVEQPRVVIAHEFVLALALLPSSEDAYVSWRSALSFWGLTEQLSKVIYVAVRRPRPAPKLGGVGRVELVVQSESRRYGITEVSVSGTPIRIATPEKAALDSLDRPDLSGGLGEVVRAVSSRASLDYDRLVDLALRHPSETLGRRLGYLMHVLSLGDPEPLRARVKRTKRPVRLDLDESAVAGYDADWRVIDNVGVESLREMIE